MPSTLTKPVRSGDRRRKRSSPSGILGISRNNSLRVARMIRAGLPFSRLAKFQKATALPWERITRLVSIPHRTLTRRESEGRLGPEESDRVWRASRIFDLAVDLFEGDVAEARRWLETPAPALGGEVPLEVATTDVGAREVENLIGRLEHGVFT